MPTDPTTSQIYRDLSVYDHSPEALDRRRFLKGALAFGGAAAMGPSMLAGQAAAGQAIAADQRILVVILMGGGNDGSGVFCTQSERASRDCAVGNDRGFRGGGRSRVDAELLCALGGLAWSGTSFDFA